MVFEAIHLSGAPRFRGRQQAEFAPNTVASVRAAVDNRLSGAKELLGQAEIQTYLEKQWEFLLQNAPTHVAEVEGIAEGYGMSARDLSTYLHLGILDRGPAPEDGCSTYVAAESDFGPFVAKNRDYGGDHRDLQRVFFHTDPSIMGKKCLFVGSLGSPGAFSSGMNSSGLALVDTRIDYREPGVGWLRYFLMTEILWRADTVDEALELIGSVPHAGGGSLALVDPSGAIASVELGHPGAVAKTSQAKSLIHTNHYVFPPFSEEHKGTLRPAREINSRARLDVLQTAAELHTNRTTLQEMVDLFSSHNPGEGSICRHVENSDSGTISTVIFCCEERKLVYYDGNPCVTTPKWISL